MDALRTLVVAPAAEVIETFDRFLALYERSSSTSKGTGVRDGSWGSTSWTTDPASHNTNTLPQHHGLQIELEGPVSVATDTELNDRMSNLPLKRLRPAMRHKYHVVDRLQARAVS